MENKILYYLGQENVEYYKGEPVYIYNFIDLDTLERLSFGQCYYYIEMQKIKGFDSLCCIKTKNETINCVG